MFFFFQVRNVFKRLCLESSTWGQLNWGGDKEQSFAVLYCTYNLGNWTPGDRREDDDFGKKKGGMVFGIQCIKKWLATDWPMPLSISQASSHVFEKNLELMQMLLAISNNTPPLNCSLIRKKNLSQATHPHTTCVLMDHLRIQSFPHI